MRSGSNESVSSPPAKGSKKDGGKTGGGIVTGSLRINVSGMGGKNVGEGPELDIPYIEDTSTTKPKVRSFIDSLLRNLTQRIILCSSITRIIIGFVNVCKHTTICYSTAWLS